MDELKPARGVIPPAGRMPRPVRTTPLRAALGMVAALVLVAGCTGAPDPVASQTSTTPPATQLPIDDDATLVVLPVDYGGRMVVRAAFGEPVPGRPVELQASTAAGWTVVATAAQGDDGAVEFQPPYTTDELRAVARRVDGNARAATEVATGSAGLKDQWSLEFDEGFDGDALPKESWNFRQTAAYFGARMCSAPYPDQIAFEDGSLLASVSRASAERTRTVRANAARKGGLPASQACPHGVWDAAMVSTEDSYAFTYGTVAVRAKFPTESGVHGSAWLQSAASEGSEIDFIETFGPRHGIQHKVHFTRDGSPASVGGYVTTLPEVATPQWWDAYHVFSVEWSEEEYVFRVDGQETLRTRDGISRGEQFIVLSLLASDWEVPRIVPDDMPATMAVDWIRVWQPT